MRHDPFANLVAAGERQIAAVSAAPLVGVVVDAPPAISPAHAAVAGALEELLALLEANAAGLPAMARMMLSTISASRGMMEDALGRLPEEQLLGILRGLAGRITAVPGVLPGV
jgi:hypothetical protein